MAYNSEYQYSSRAGSIIFQWLITVKTRAVSIIIPMAYNSEYQYSSRAGRITFQWLTTVNTNTLVELGVQYSNGL